MRGWKLLKTESKLMLSNQYVYRYKEFTWEHPKDKTQGITRTLNRRWVSQGNAKYPKPHQSTRECERRRAQYA